MHLCDTISDLYIEFQTSSVPTDEENHLRVYRKARFDLALLFDPCYWDFRVLGCRFRDLRTNISLKMLRVRTPNFQGGLRVAK